MFITEIESSNDIIRRNISKLISNLTIGTTIFIDEIIKNMKVILNLLFD